MELLWSSADDTPLQQVQGVAPGVRSLVLPRAITLLRHTVRFASAAAAAAVLVIPSESDSDSDSWMLPSDPSMIGRLGLATGSMLGVLTTLVNSDLRPGEHDPSFFGNNDYNTVKASNDVIQRAHDKKHAAIVADMKAREGVRKRSTAIRDRALAVVGTRTLAQYREQDTARIMAAYADAQANSP
jgi:hypothetical protein